MEQILDRDHPLWELWFVEGVDRGEHVGLVHKSHHTLTDGISGIDIATALFDFSREPTVIDAPEWHPRPAPDPARLVIDGLCERIRQPVELADLARRGVAAPRDVVDRASLSWRGRSARSSARTRSRPRCRSTDPIGRGRRIETRPRRASNR